MTKPNTQPCDRCGLPEKNSFGVHDLRWPYSHTFAPPPEPEVICEGDLRSIAGDLLPDRPSRSAQQAEQCGKPLGHEIGKTYTRPSLEIPDDLLTDEPEACECVSYVGSNIAQLWTGEHHPNCPHRPAQQPPAARTDEGEGKSPELFTKADLQGYYIGYDPTGNPEIDAILGAIALAGRAYHSTDGWQENIDDSETSYDQNIQNAANAAAAQHTAATARLAEYDELLMAVVRKFPNETRHETALRYIREAETPSGASPPQP